MLGWVNRPFPTQKLEISQKISEKWQVWKSICQFSPKPAPSFQNFETPGLEQEHDQIAPYHTSILVSPEKEQKLNFSAQVRLLAVQHCTLVRTR